MKMYRIEVTEVLSREVCLMAEDEKEAINTVMAKYKNNGIVLDTSDYVLTEFSVKDEISEKELQFLE